MISILSEVSASDGRVVIIVCIITGFVTIVTSVITSGRKTDKAAEKVATAATEKLDLAVGIPNGRGSLMLQMAESQNLQLAIQENQLTLQKHVMTINDRLSDHIRDEDGSLVKIHQRIDMIHTALEKYIKHSDLELVQEKG